MKAGFSSGWMVFAGPLMLNSAVYLTTEPAPLELTSIESKIRDCLVLAAEFDVVFRQLDDLVLEGLVFAPELRLCVVPVPHSHRTWGQFVHHRGTGVPLARVFELTHVGKGLFGGQHEFHTSGGCDHPVTVIITPVQELCGGKPTPSHARLPGPASLPRP